MTKIEDSEEDRRAGFVDWLLNADDSRLKAPSDNKSALDEFQKPYIEENKTLSSAVADPIAESMFLYSNLVIYFELFWSDLLLIGNIKWFRHFNLFFYCPVFA